MRLFEPLRTHHHHHHENYFAAIPRLLPLGVGHCPTAPGVHHAGSAVGAGPTRRGLPHGSPRRHESMAPATLNGGGEAPPA